MKLHYIISVLLFCFFISSCKTSGTIKKGEPAEGTVFLWLGADKDAYVSCGRPTVSGCPKKEWNFGNYGTLVVAFNGVALKKSYVHFGLPILPEGTEIKAAYFELYHGGKNEDGKTDNLRIPVAMALSSWSPLKISLANEPNKSLSGIGTYINLNSQDWSGTPNIASLIRAWYANPSSNHGFYIYWPRPETPGIEKGFYSNNSYQRTAEDLWLSPRLLLKVHLPQGTTASDIKLPPLPADTDLDFGGQEVLMMLYQGGREWPDEWEVREGK